jgi:hypothetical protein
MLNDIMLCEELFHTTSGVAFADFITVGHRETWPIRSKRFRTWLWRCYYQATGDAPSAAALRSALDLLEARAQLMRPSGASTSVSLSMPAGCILILPISIGVRLRLDPMAGECSNVRQCGSVGLQVCCCCRCWSAADRLTPCARSSIY